MRDETHPVLTWCNTYAVEQEALCPLSHPTALAGHSRGFVLYSPPGVVVARALMRVGDAKQALAEWQMGAEELLRTHRASRRSVMLICAGPGMGELPDAFGSAEVRAAIIEAAGGLADDLHPEMAEIGYLLIESDRNAASCARSLAAATVGGSQGAVSQTPGAEVSAYAGSVALAALARHADLEAERCVSANLAAQVADLEDAVLKNAERRFKTEVSLGQEKKQAQRSATARDADVARRDEALREAEARAAHLEAELQAARIHIEELTNSTSWKLTKPARSTADFLKGLRAPRSA